MMRPVSVATRTVVRGVFLFGLWLVLVDTVAWPELVVGAGAAALTAVFATLVYARRSEHVRLTPGMLRFAYRPLVLLVADTWRVAAALVRELAHGQPVEGRLRAVRYTATGGSADDVGRRILTEWGTSVAANRYAVGIDVERDYLLVHQLVEAPGPLDPLELG
jgi:catechol 2,3-dioxygenase-like lactoylglutathione lyase family enzyme